MDIVQLLSQPWFGNTIAVLALGVAGYAIWDVRHQRAKDAALPLAEMRFETGPVPFGPEWRQGVLDIRAEGENRRLELVEFSTKSPKDLMLATGFNGDTNKGPDVSTAAQRHTVLMPFETQQMLGAPKVSFVSFDVFYKHRVGEQLAGVTVTLEVVLRDQNTGKVTRHRVSKLVPPLPVVQAPAV